MSQERQYAVYILTNAHGTVLYTGVTGNLEKRIWEHKNHAFPGFTSKYRCHRLVWYEFADNAYAAISREKQIKAGSRKKKIALVEALNPGWNDLASEWFLRG